MDIYTVSFFGHREMYQTFKYEKILEKYIRKLIETKMYVDFLVGRDGDFDQMVSSTIVKCVESLDYGNTSHILVLPYMRADYRDNEEYFLKYYDEVEICAASSSAHFKSAITIRNHYMIDRSDLVIFCVDHKGGAYNAMKYAEKNGKDFINIHWFIDE